MLDKDAKLETSNHDFGRDIILAAIRKQTVYAFPFTDLEDLDKPGSWLDVGAVDSYWKDLNVEFTDVYGNSTSTSTVRTGRYRHTNNSFTPAKFVFDEQSRRGSAMDSLVSGGCIVSGALVRPVLGRTH